MLKELPPGEMDGMTEQLSAELSAMEELLSATAEEELKHKKEVVFIPYKTSLWGGMESVWQAAGQRIFGSRRPGTLLL